MVEVAAIRYGENGDGDLRSDAAEYSLLLDATLTGDSNGKGLSGGNRYSAADGDSGGSGSGSGGREGKSSAATGGGGVVAAAEVGDTRRRLWGRSATSASSLSAFTVRLTVGCAPNAGEGDSFLELCTRV